MSYDDDIDDDTSCSGIEALVKDDRSIAMPEEQGSVPDTKIVHVLEDKIMGDDEGSSIRGDYHHLSTNIFTQDQSPTFIATLFSGEWANHHQS